MEKEFQSEFKKFSREEFPEERQEVAGVIKEKRHIYFEHHKELSSRIQELFDKSEEKKGKVSKIIKEIENLKQALSERKKSKFLEFLNYFEIKKLSKELSGKSLTQDQFEEEYQQAVVLLQSLEQEAQNKRELLEAKEYLKDFYYRQSKEWEEYQEEDKAKNIASVAQHYNVAVVHGIHPNFVPGDNSLLNRNVDWQTKLKIILALEPTLSASTIKNGDTFRNMWARMGVLLSDGSIENAMPSDSGTRAKSLKKREIGAIKRPNKVSDQIGEAINQRDQNSYNELTIESPKVAGFYVCPERTSGGHIGNDLVEIEEIIREVQEIGLPLYIIQDGVIREAEYNPQLKELVPKLTITSEQLIQERFDMPVEQKQKIKEELLVDVPFKLEFLEAKCIDARFRGGQTYIEINAPKDIDLFGQEQIKYERDSNGECGELSLGHDIEGKSENMDVRVVQSLRGVDSSVEYFIDQGKLLRRWKSKAFKEGFHGSVIKYIEEFDKYKSGFINLTGFMTEKLNRPIETNDDYILGMEEAVERWTKLMKGIIQEKYNGQIDFHKEVLQELAFHLYGFGEQAEFFHDLKTKEKCFDLANKVLLFEKYTGIIQRRIDEYGRFKITEEDLLES